jgi:hypothetical protein
LWGSTGLAATLDYTSVSNSPINPVSVFLFLWQYLPHVTVSSFILDFPETITQDVSDYVKYFESHYKLQKRLEK